MKEPSPQPTVEMAQTKPEARSVIAYRLIFNQKTVIYMKMVQKSAEKVLYRNGVKRKCLKSYMKVRILQKFAVYNQWRGV